jgi:hypothetical protein
MRGDWRRIARDVAAATKPQTPETGKPSEERFPTVMRHRHEWEGYRSFVASLGRDTRIPTFSDYAVAHPDLVELDMRLIKPFAKLRYTTTDKWRISRGSPVRTHGFGQFQEMCQELVKAPCFDGRGSCAGDDYIADCAAGKVQTGNLLTWVWVSTNRHLTKVVGDLANVHGLSIAA